MKMNFSKKALALVMAVLMVLSSASILAFAAPKNNLADNNAEAIKDVLTVDNNVETQVTHFGYEYDGKTPFSGNDRFTKEQREEYHKNVLYAPNASTASSAKDLWWGPGGFGNVRTVAFNVYYGVDSILIDDGKTLPSLGFIVRPTWTANVTADYVSFRKIQIKNNISKENAKLVCSNNWNRLTKEQERVTDGELDFMGIVTNTKKETYDFSGDTYINVSNNEKLKAFTNVFSLERHLPDTVYYTSFKPTFSFEYVRGSLSWLSKSTGETSNTKPIHVLNYAPLKKALEKAQSLVNEVNTHKDLYTNASVKELVRLTNDLLAAKPDNILKENINRGAANVLSAYANAVKPALAAWNAWDKDQATGGLELATVDLVHVTEQTFAVDFDGKASYNLNANEPQREEAQVTYLGYSMEPQETDKTLSVGDATYTGLANGSATINTAYGKIKLDKHGNISYDITDLAKFTQPVSIYVLANIKVNASQNACKWKKVTILPANSIYIEDDNQSVFNYTGNWTPATSAENSAVAGAEDLEEFGNIHGYDSAYANSDKYSAGKAMKTVVKPGTKATVTFTFTGTGFDVISLASNKSGVFLVEVKDAQGQRVKAAMVDTYTNSKFTGSTWVDDASGATALYQIPAIKIEGLSYGTYSVTITPRLSNNNPANECEFILDGVRVYNPMKNQKPYEKDNEANAKYTEVNTILVPGEKLSKLNQNGIVFINNGKVTNAAELKKINEISANHELYLSKGQTIAFTVEGKPASVQVGAKKVGSISGTPKMNGVAINTSTEMYYELAESNGIYTVTNNGDGILSLTNIKTTSKTAAAVNFRVNEATPRLAMATMNAPKADLSVKASAPVVDGKTVTIKATTSLDVAVLNVTDANGKAIDAKITSRINGNVKEWTVEIVEANAGTHTYVISGEYDCGFTNDSASAVVKATIEEVAAPQLTFGQKVVNFFKKIFGIKF